MDKSTMPPIYDSRCALIQRQTFTTQNSLR